VSDRPTPVGALLRAAPPDRLPAVVTEHLRRHHASGRVKAVDAGSPRTMISREGDIRPVSLEQQLPLGMFGEIRYETQRFHLEPGDRLLVVSDGVHAAGPRGRASYGESALLTAVRRTRLQPATEAVSTVMRGLREYHAGTDPSDDAVTVCLDWRR
jgi:serine phosphatase RsbU (regulator of sigma subunit)